MRKGFGVLLLLWAVSLHGITYQLIELPPASGSSAIPTRAYGMNDAHLSGNPDYGYIAGVSGSGSSQRAIRWTVSTSGILETKDLGLISPYTWAIAYDVNDDGHVVGTMGNLQAFIWRFESIPQLQAIPATSPARCLVAYAINDADKVVGSYSKFVGSGGPVHPFWGFGWTPAGVLVLYKSSQNLASAASNAQAVNDDGLAAGAAQVSSDGSFELEWQAHTWSPTPTPIGNGFSQAYGINDSDVVGTGAGKAILWDGGALTDLGPGTARDINNDNPGQIVGFAPKTGGGTYAFVQTTSTSRVDLNTETLFPSGSGWQLAEAHAINDWGWIAGIGSRLVDGVRVTKGFVLIPTDQIP